MANTKSAKKAILQSQKKRQHNLFWKGKIKDAVKTINRTIKTEDKNPDILNQQVSLLQKALDKASKENVIHKNKANRIKSRYALKITAHEQGKSTKSDKPTKPGKSAKSSKKS